MILSTLKRNDYTIPLKYHIIFWVGYFLFNVIRWGSYFNDYWYSLKSNLVEFPLHILLVYFTIYFLIPNYILKKKYTGFLIYFLLSLALLYLVRTGLNYVLVTKNIWPEAEGIQKAFTFNHIVAVVLGEIYVIALVSAIKLTVDWIAEKRKNDKLKKAQLQSELSFLKTQIQPHFFFNTLNNLYALAMEKSDDTPDVVLKLSDIMQYVLYDAKHPTIPLLKEVNYIHSYLDLERLRYGDAVKASLSIKGGIDGVCVPPLLFLPFIENCFKHGPKNGDNILVDINFTKKSGELLFDVKNNFDPSLAPETKHGIGIKNVKRRLQLLYPSNFDLDIKIVDTMYTVNLTIPIP